MPIKATAAPNAIVVAAITPTCLNVTPFVAFVILPRATPNIVKDMLIIAIEIEPSNIKLNAAGIPNIATAPPNMTVNAAITPTCLNVTPFVADAILLSATLNNINDKLIISILIAPFAIWLRDLLSILNVKTFTATIPNNTTDPNNAGTPTFAIEARTKDVNAITPVNASNPIEARIALLICFLFLYNFLVTGIIASTIRPSAFAPNVPSNAGTSVAAKNIDAIDKLPASTNILFAAFSLLSIVFLFL